MGRGTHLHRIRAWCNLGTAMIRAAVGVCRRVFVGRSSKAAPAAERGCRRNPWLLFGFRFFTTNVDYAAACLPKNALFLFLPRVGTPTLMCRQHHFCR